MPDDTQSTQVLAEIRDAAVSAAASLDRIADAVEALQQGQAAAHALSSSLIERAQQGMAAQEAEAAEARAAIAAPVPVDPHPFEALPAGTTVRYLPDGARLFGFSGGESLRAAPDGRLVAFATDGTPHVLAPARDRYIKMPSGTLLRLKRGAVRTTHEALGISGLPIEVEPELVAEERYRIELSKVRLELDRRARRLLVLSPTGSVLVLGPRIEGIGETVEVRLVPGGMRGFTAVETGHAGAIESDGTIHLALAGGIDLTVRFPAPGPGDPAPPPRTFPCGARS
jgi:hypothetical protein